MFETKLLLIANTFSGNQEKGIGSKFVSNETTLIEMLRHSSHEWANYENGVLQSLNAVY